MDSSKQEEYTLVKVDVADPRYEDVKAARAELYEGLCEDYIPLMHSNDEKCDLYLLYQGDKAVATVRFFLKPEGYKLERMAVLKGLQGKGIGKILVNKTMENYQDPTKPVFLHARSHVREFYRKCKFEAVGEEFDEAGITHIKMVYKP